MINVRSPLRISLGGGSTDLPSYYEKEEGHFITAAINKYVYVSIIKPFTNGIFLKYSELENVDLIEKIKHPIFRETLKLLLSNEKQIEISSLADIPAGTGLGSSGSFTSALVKAIYTYNNNIITAQEVAKLASKIEIELLNEPVGKQDQYASAFGGITSFNVNKSGKVKHDSLNVRPSILHNLEDNLLLFFTGFNRSASKILSEQNIKTLDSDSDVLKNLNIIKAIGYEVKKSIQSGDLVNFAKMMNEQWELKKQRSNSVSNKFIDECIQFGLSQGAIGGKLVGAGGGGFILFYTEDRQKLRKAMQSNGLEELRFNFDFEGTKVM